MLVGYWKPIDTTEHPDRGKINGWLINPVLAGAGPGWVSVLRFLKHKIENPLICIHYNLVMHT